MKLTTPIFLLLATLIISSCKPDPSPGLEYVDVNGDLVPKINIEQITEKGSLKVSEWFKDLELIELESNEQTLMKNVWRKYVGEDYIIISSNECGVIQFDRAGDFVKVLAKIGQGPGEVSDPNRNIFVDEENNKLYVIEPWRRNGKILAISILSGKHDYIQLANTGDEFGIRDIIAVDDSLIYCTTMQAQGAKSQNPVFCQTTSGRLIWEEKRTHPSGLTESSIYLVDNTIYFAYLFLADTLFRIDNHELMPDLILSMDRPNAFLVKEKGSAYSSIRAITSEIYQGAFVELEQVIKNEGDPYGEDVYSEMKEFVFNRRTNQIMWTGSLENDFFSCSEHFYFQIFHNGMAAAAYQAIDLLDMADSIYNVPNVSSEVKARMVQILETVDAEDNPYLLVGKLKI